MAGYVLGKVEGQGKDWHGHVTALAVAPAYRRRGLAGALMDALEGVSAREHNAFYVDLFVRASNAAAISMYEKVKGVRRERKWREVEVERDGERLLLLTHSFPPFPQHHSSVT